MAAASGEVCLVWFAGCLVNLPSTSAILCCFISLGSYSLISYQGFLWVCGHISILNTQLVAWVSFATVFGGYQECFVPSTLEDAKVIAPYHSYTYIYIYVGIYIEWVGSRWHTPLKVVYMDPYIKDILGLCHLLWSHCVYICIYLCVCILAHA